MEVNRDKAILENIGQMTSNKCIKEFYKYRIR